MIEYAIVLAFGVIILIQGGANAPVKQLATAIKNYHEHYTYAMAIAYIPDCDYQFDYGKSQSLADIGSIGASISVGVDRCFDFQDPKLPALSVNLAFDVVGNVGDAVKKIITDSVTASITNFLDPSSFMSSITFKPSDFF